MVANMKYIVIVGDGMADYPLRSLGNVTPLGAARKPNLDFLAANGILGLVNTTPKGMTPGTDVANLSILGYDTKKFYSGRGPLEAMNFGIKLSKENIVFRCNLVTVCKEKLADYSAGHIETKQAKVLIGELGRKLGSSSIRFYPGVSYRHLMVIKCKSRVLKNQLLRVKCLPPHDVMNKPLKEILPEGKGSEVLLKLMSDSRRVLSKHKANMIWLWGQGEKPDLPLFHKKFGLKGAIISAVDIMKGIGRAAGFDVINVPGATGYYDTNYEGKAKRALSALKKNDFVFVHIEAPDEAGHNGDVREKIKAIENIDKKVVGTIIEGMKKYSDYRILALTDHPTPISLKTHASNPVPFTMYGEGKGKVCRHCGGQASGTTKRKDSPHFDECSAEKSKLFFRKGYNLMKFFLRA
jgi:2,3-bisphosphoglycerate-independent phosphoglycerate mutase